LPQRNSLVAPPGGAISKTIAPIFYTSAVLADSQKL